MSIQLEQLIATTLVAIVVTLVHAYITRGGQQTQQQTTQQASEVMKEAGALIGTSATASGGGTTPGRMDSFTWLSTGVIPAYGQLTQTLPSVSDTSTWYNDCGETCCSMIVRSCRGVYVPGDELRVLLRGQGGSPLTTPQDLVSILNICHIKAHTVIWGMPDAANYMDAITKDGRPLIALGMWPTPGGALHWMVCTHTDVDKIYYINPWGANASWILRSDWGGYSTNDYVVVDSHLLFT